jgi:hypothetical protein
MCEREYNAILEQQFQLKYHGKFSIFEQNHMTAEDRAWHMKRLQKEFADRAEAEKKASQGHRH